MKIKIDRIFNAETKKGKKYWKLIGADEICYFVWDEEIAKDLQKNIGKTFDLEVEGDDFKTIKSILGRDEKVTLPTSPVPEANIPVLKTSIQDNIMAQCVYKSVCDMVCAGKVVPEDKWLMIIKDFGNLKEMLRNEP